MLRKFNIRKLPRRNQFVSDKFVAIIPIFHFFYSRAQVTEMYFFPHFPDIMKHAKSPADSESPLFKLTINVTRRIDRVSSIIETLSLFYSLQFPEY